MNSYIIKNDNSRFGFIVELDVKKSTSDFKVYKINTQSEDEKGEDLYGVEMVVEGYLKWDGCSNLTFGDNGYLHFCETDDLICLNKSLSFIWEESRKHYQYAEYVDKWEMNGDNIEIFTGKFKLLS